MERLGRIAGQVLMVTTPAAAVAIEPRPLQAVMTSGSATSLGCDVGILTEATGDHLGGFLGGLATAAGIRSVSVADITGGAHFKTVRNALPAPRMGGEYISAQAMLSEHKPALTLVTAEAHNSSRLVRAALETGSHVIVEKPGCLTLAEFEDVCAFADKKGLEVMLAMPTRVNPAIVKVKEMIEAGFLGTPFSATMDWVADQTRLTRWEHLYPPEQAGELSWKYSRGKTPGGKLIFHGTHYIDVIQWLVGDTITDVAAITGNVGGTEIENEDAACISFRMGCGLMGTLNAGYYVVQGGKHTQLRLWGSLGWFHLELDGRERPLHWQSTHPDAPEGEQIFEWERRDGYRDFTAAAVAFATGAGPPPITTRESRAALQAAFAGYASAQSGRTQRVLHLDD